jgi:hypothetical protein
MIKLKQNEILTNILKKDLDDFWDDCICTDNSPTCRILFNLNLL